jgi:hypothetical protein
MASFIIWGQPSSWCQADMQDWRKAIIDLLDQMRYVPFVELKDGTDREVIVID